MRKRPAPELVIGSFVRVAPAGPVHRIVWRGKLIIPATSDWPGEMVVYRLDNEFWDCYYGYQLYPARPWDTNPLSSVP